MDSFENVVAMALRREGYWTITSFKVELTKTDRHRIGRPASPRWELDVIAYNGATNGVLAVECKSFLDSPGVVFRSGKFEPDERYKLFTDGVLRRVVLKRVAKQLEQANLCRTGPTVQLCLAAGKTASKTDSNGLKKHFARKNWRLFDRAWIKAHLEKAARSRYENDVAYVVAKLLLHK